MRIHFEEISEVGIPGLNGGEGTTYASMFIHPGCKIMRSRLPVGASIGLHLHEGSCEINYVISGTGRAVCDGVEEELSPGVCHFCPQGSAHAIRNTGTEDLSLFTVVFDA